MEQIEGRFAELSRQMSDPEVIGDHRRYADVGRAYRALEPANELAQQWRRATDDAAGRPRAAGRGRRGPGGARDARDGGVAARRAGGGDPPGDGRARSQRRQERDRGGARRRRRGRGRPVRRRPVPHAHPLRRAPRLQDRAAVGGRRRLHLRHQGRRRLQRVQARGRHAPRAARAGDRVAGPDPHLDRHRGRAARGGGGGRAGGPERPPGGRLPLLGSRRAVGEHHRLRRAHHPQADRARGVDAGREVAAPEPRQGDARAARPPARARDRRPAGGAGGRPQGAGGHAASAPRRSAPTTSPRTA